jgi:hypothetical protein
MLEPKLTKLVIKNTNSRSVNLLLQTIFVLLKLINTIIVAKVANNVPKL